MAVRILPDDTWNDIAIKIYRDFEVGQSCAITGFFVPIPEFAGADIDINKIQEKGLLVWDKIREMDRHDNINENGKRKVRYAGKNTIGGVLAGKIFQYNRVVIDKATPKWTIWRLQ